MSMIWKGYQRGFTPDTGSYYESKAVKVFGITIWRSEFLDDISTREALEEANASVLPKIGFEEPKDDVSESAES